MRVFGSVARGADRADSDIDILLAMEDDRSLLDLVGLEQQLKDLLGRGVDVLTDAASLDRAFVVRSQLKLAIVKAERFYFGHTQSAIRDIRVVRAFNQEREFVLAPAHINLGSIALHVSARQIVCFPSPRRASYRKTQGYGSTSRMKGFASEVRYALRGLRKDARFVAAALCLVVLGASTASSLVGGVDALLWPPAPVADPESLKFVYSSHDGLWLGVRYDEATSILDAAVFDVSALRSADRARVRREHSVWHWSGDAVSWNYFDVTGHRAVRGRTFVEADGDASADPVVVISNTTWRTTFNSEPNIIGSSVTLVPAMRGVRDQGGRSYTIIGVLEPAAERLASPFESTQYWVPVLPRALDYACDIDVLRYGLFYVIGRLQNGVSDAMANAALVPINAEYSRTVQDPERRSLVIRGSRSVRLPFGSALLSVDRLAVVSFTLAGILLTVAAVNLAGLLIARRVSRRTDSAVRHALRATTPLLAIQATTESVALAVGGFLFSLVAAGGLVQVAAAHIPGLHGGAGAPLNAFSYRFLIIVACIHLVTCMAAAVGATLMGSREKGLAPLTGSGRRPIGPAPGPSDPFS